MDSKRPQVWAPQVALVWRPPLGASHLYHSDFAQKPRSSRASVGSTRAWHGHALYVALRGAPHSWYHNGVAQHMRAALHPLL